MCICDPRVRRDSVLNSVLEKPPIKSFFNLIFCFSVGRNSDENLVLTRPKDKWESLNSNYK